MKTRVSVTPQQWSEGWQSGMRNAVPKIQRGVAAVTESPTAKAAGKKDAWLAGVNRAHMDGSYERGCLSVTLQAWKDLTAAKVATSLPTGVTAAAAKVTNIATQLTAHINQALPTVNAMPKVTLQDSVAKVSAWMTHMAAFRRA